MSIKDINNKPNAVKTWLDNERAAEEQYFNDNIDSLIPFFKNELINLGFQFETSNQATALIPRHKKEILPIAIKYYRRARELYKSNEQDYFIRFLYIKGLDEVVPMLLEDFYSQETTDLTRWFISDCIYQIRSKKFVKKYLDIVSNKAFGINRQMFVLLLGKLKEDCAISTLVDLLEDEEVRLHAISALGEFKREEFRRYFERFQDSKHPGWRKYARAALKKLDRRIENDRI